MQQSHTASISHRCVFCGEGVELEVRQAALSQVARVMGEGPRASLFGCPSILRLSTRRWRTSTTFPICHPVGRGAWKKRKRMHVGLGLGVGCVCAHDYVFRTPLRAAPSCPRFPAFWWYRQELASSVLHAFPLRQCAPCISINLVSLGVRVPTTDPANMK